jgi:hypothetical protein
MEVEGAALLIVIWTLDRYSVQFHDLAVLPPLFVGHDADEEINMVVMTTVSPNVAAE